MSGRATRRKPAAEVVGEVPSKQQKLDEHDEKKTAPVANENDPPKPVGKESPLEAEAGAGDATEGTGGSKLIFRILHCTSWSVFKRNAVAIGDALRKEFGLIEVSLNPDGKPKRGSFEIFLVKDGDVLLWSGAEKGPPRKLKFPEHTKIIELTKKHL